MEFYHNGTHAVLQRSGSVEINFGFDKTKNSINQHSPRGVDYIPAHNSPTVQSPVQLEHELRLVEEELGSRQTKHNFRYSRPNALSGTKHEYNSAFSSKSLINNGMRAAEYNARHSPSPLSVRSANARQARNEYDLSNRIQQFKYRSHGVSPSSQDAFVLDELPPQQTPQSGWNSPMHSPGFDGTPFVSADGQYGRFGTEVQSTKYVMDGNRSPPQALDPPLVSPPRHSTSTLRPNTRKKAFTGRMKNMVKSPLQHLKARNADAKEDGNVKDKATYDKETNVRDQLVEAKLEEEKFRQELKDLEFKISGVEREREEIQEKSTRERRNSKVQLEKRDKEIKLMKRDLAAYEKKFDLQAKEIKNLKSELELAAAQAASQASKAIPAPAPPSTPKSPPTEATSAPEVPKPATPSRKSEPLNIVKLSKTMLQEGMLFMKHGRRGSPHIRFVCASHDGEVLYYGAPECEKIEKMTAIPISSIVEVKKGHTTEVFARSKRGRAHACFSVIMEDKTLDLELVPFGPMTTQRKHLEEEARDFWFAAIKFLKS